MKMEKILALLLCGTLMAGCSSATKSTDSSTTKEEKTEETTKSDSSTKKDTTTEEKEDTTNSNSSSQESSTNETSDDLGLDLNTQSIVEGAKVQIATSGCTDDLTLTGVYAGYYDKGYELYQIGFLTSANTAYMVTYYTENYSLRQNVFDAPSQLSHHVNGVCGPEACPGSDNYTYTTAGEVNAALVNARQAYSWDVIYEKEAPDQALFSQGAN